MRKCQIKCPILITHPVFPSRYRDELFTLIEQSPQEKVKANSDFISATDYNLNLRNNIIGGSYTSLLLSLLRKSIDELLDEYLTLSEKNPLEHHRYLFDPTAMWFQRYTQNNTHEWHDHGNSTFSLIYYLELPRGTPNTEFKDHCTGRIIRPRVKEGDLVMFPSFLKHRSPKNKSNKTKTIISFNMN